MKQFYLKYLFFGILSLMSITASAYDCEVDGIYYNLNKTDMTASVTWGSPKYSGAVTIPSTIAYSGTTYNVTSIMGNAFLDCTGLTSVIIPSSVTSIGNVALGGCSGLASIVVESGNSVYDSRNNCNAIIETASNTLIAGCKNTKIPSSVTIIGYGAFAGCSGLTSVVIPSSVTIIGYGAFYNCSGLTSVVIPSSVSSIEDIAFKWCPRLATIYSLNPIPPTCNSSNIFTCSTSSTATDYFLRDEFDIYTYATLHVPMGSGEVYSSAFEWRYFNKIKEDMESDGNVYYANLTVKQGAIGYTRQAVKADTRHTIYIGSLGENKVNTVTFNGVDVTDEVVNGYYTTPEIKGESVLSISFETNSSVKSMTLNNLKVMGYNGEIQIMNIDEPSDVFVYTVDGKLVGNLPSAYGSANIQVASEELYVVKVGNRVFKVAL